MKRILILCIGICLVAGSISRAQDSSQQDETPASLTERGRIFNVAGKYAEAFACFQKAAGQGYAEAQEQLGFLYYNGKGVDLNNTEAVVWFRKASEQGLASAQNQLGHMYEHGLGVAKSYEEAFNWYKKSGDQEDATGLGLVGYMYQNGYGVAKNIAEAITWYAKAAERGNAYAANTLVQLLSERNNISNFTETKNNLNIEMIAVRGGRFMMGCPAEQGANCEEETKPSHPVTVFDFYIGKYEVTQAQWKAIMGTNPSKYKDDNLPVERVSWNDVRDFIYRLNSVTGKQYRLPTEAEWEFAARGGNNTRRYRYSGGNSIDAVAWFEGNSGSTHPVGTKTANELGIHDMNGNVYEWCRDRYGLYSADAQINPQGPLSGDYRSLRGGSWATFISGLQISSRACLLPDHFSEEVGFRLACSVE